MKFPGLVLRDRHQLRNNRTRMVRLCRGKTHAERKTEREREREQVARSEETITNKEQTRRYKNKHPIWGVLRQSIQQLNSLQSLEAKGLELSNSKTLTKKKRGEKVCWVFFTNTYTGMLGYSPHHLPPYEPLSFPQEASRGNRFRPAIREDLSLLFLNVTYQPLH